MYSRAAFGPAKQEARFHFRPGLAGLHSKRLNPSILRTISLTVFEAKWHSDCCPGRIVRKLLLKFEASADAFS